MNPQLPDRAPVRVSATVNIGGHNWFTVRSVSAVPAQLTHCYVRELLEHLRAIGGLIEVRIHEPGDLVGRVVKQ